MMKIKILFILIGLSIGFASCKSTNTDIKKIDDTDIIDVKGKEYTSKYICPMHCKGSGSDEMGTCPVCGMDYELNEELENGHHHDDDDHDGHQHDGSDGIENHKDHDHHNH